jgi:hypothetical protein
VPLGETASAAPIWAVKDDFSKIYGFEIVIVIDLWLNTRLSMGGKGFSILQLTTTMSLTSVKTRFRENRDFSRPNYFTNNCLLL